MIRTRRPISASARVVLERRAGFVGASGGTPFCGRLRPASSFSSVSTRLPSRSISRRSLREVVARDDAQMSGIASRSRSPTPAAASACRWLALPTLSRATTGRRALLGSPDDLVDDLLRAVAGQPGGADRRLDGALDRPANGVRRRPAPTASPASRPCVVGRFAASASCSAASRPSRLAALRRLWTVRVPERFLEAPAATWFLGLADDRGRLAGESAARAGLGPDRRDVARELLDPRLEPVELLGQPGRRVRGSPPIIASSLVPSLSTPSSTSSRRCEIERSRRASLSRSEAVGRFSASIADCWAWPTFSRAVNAP